MSGIISNKLGGASNATKGGIPANQAVQSAYQSASNSLRYVPEEQRSGIQAKLQEIAQGNRPPSGLMGAAAKVLNAPGIKQALIPLSVLDVPRRVVISAGKEYYDALSGNGDASFSDLYNQAKDPTFGVGKFVDTGNKWTDRILGFVGDVAFDPLTYVTLGTSKAAGFGQKLAAAGKMVDAGGDAVRAARLTREGSWFLTPAERELAGLSQSGLYFMGQRIKGTGKAGVAGEAAFAKGRLLVSDRQFVQAIRSAFTPNDAKVARLALKRGEVPDADTAKQYIDVIRSSDAERYATTQAGNVANNELKNSVVGNTNEKVLLDIGSRAGELLENPAALATATDAEKNFVQKSRLFLDNLYKRVNDSTKSLNPEANIGYQQNYFPHVMTPVAKEYASSNKQLQNLLRLSQEQLRRPGFVEPRRLVADGKTKFFGVTLEEGDLTVKRLNEIARQGGFKGNFFEPNAIPVLRGYVQSHSREMGRLARFKYLDDKGILDRVIQRAVPNQDLINQQGKRIADVMQLAKSANTKSRDAFSKFNLAVNDALTTVRNADNATLAGVELNYRSSQDALQQARVAVDDALADLSNTAESLRSLFMTQDLSDDSLLATLINQVDETEQQLNAMIEAALGSADDNKRWLNDFASAEGDVADLRLTLERMDSMFDKLSETIGKTATYQQFFSTNFDRIIRGELDASSLADDLSDDIREKVSEIAGTVRGTTEAARGSRGLPTGRREGLQRRLTESAWFRGITQVAPLNDKTIALMTGDTRNKILNNAARMGSTLYETESVGANMIARAHDFFGSEIESVLSRRGVTNPEEVRQIVRGLMPPELASAEDELLSVMQESAGVRQSVMRDVSRGKSVKTYDRKAAAERTFRQMQSDQEVLDVARDNVETLLRKKDSLIEDSLKAHGVKISFKKSGEAYVKGGPDAKIPNIEAIDNIDSEVRQLRKTIQEIESKVHTIGYGQDKTVKRFSLDANEGLKPQIRGGKKGLRGADKEPIGGLSALEKYIDELEYKTEVMDIKKGQKRAVYRAGELAKGSRDLHRRLGVAVERYNIVSEVWRRSLATEELMAEMGLQINDNHLRVITERVLNERGKVWQDRVFQLDSANRQLRELKSAMVSAEVSGDFVPVEEMIQKVFNAKGRKNFLRDVVGTTDTFKIDSEVSSVRRLWDDYQRVLRDRKTAMGQMAPESAFADLTRTRETAGNAGVAQDVDAAAEQFVRATNPGELRQRAVETSDSLVLWYNQKVGTLEKGVDYKISKGYRSLTASGNRKVNDAIEGLQTSTLPSQMIIDIAQEQLTNESMLISKMNRLFRNVYDFEDGKFVRGGGQKALDPYADPRLILAGEYQSTPLSVAGIYKIQAERIQAKLEDAYTFGQRAAGLRAEAEGVTALTARRRGQLAAGMQGRPAPRLMDDTEYVPPMPETSYGRTTAFSKEITEQRKKVSELKKKSRSASTPQLKSRYKNQADAAQSVLDDFIERRDALRPVRPLGKEDEAARLRNLATEGFRTEAGTNVYGKTYSTAYPRKIIDAQREANKKLVSLEQLPEMAAARVGQQVYESLQSLVGREMGNISIKDRFVSFANSVWGSPDDGSLNPIARQFAGNDGLEQFQFSRGEWASLFSSDTGIAARGRANKKIKELETQIAEFDVKARNASTPSVRTRFNNRANELREVLDETMLARDIADPAVRDVGRAKFKALNNFIDETAEQLDVGAEDIRRFVFSGSFVDASTASVRRDALQNGWRVSADYSLLKQYDEIADSAPLQLAKNQREEISFLEDRLATLTGEKGPFGSFGFAERQAEEALGEAREAANTAARIGQGVSGRAGIPAGKPANTKPIIPVASELGIAPAQVARAGDAALDNAAERMLEASERATKIAGREYGLKKSKVELSPQAASLIKQLESLDLRSDALRRQLGDAELNLARLTPMAETVRNAKLKDWEPAIRGISAVLNGTVDKNGKTARKGLYKKVEETQASIASRFDEASGKQEAVARRLSEAEIVFGDASLVASYASGALESIKPMLVERIEAINEVLKGSKKPSGKFDAQAREEMISWGNNAQELLARLDADPDNKALGMFAEAQIANWQSKAFDSMVISEKELLEKVKAGFGSKETVAMLQDGWVRLGGFSDAELKNAKRVRKGMAKDDPERALLKNKASIDLGMPGLQVPRAVADAMENVTKSLSTPNGVVQATQFISKYTQFFKAYATASPGFHVRNAISDFFSMLSGDANVVNMNEARKHLAPYMNDPDNWLKNIPLAQRGEAEKAMQAALASGGGQYTDALDEFMVRGDTWVYNNKFLNLMKRTGHKQDFMRRYMFAYDRIKKGMDVEKATADTRRYLIDYMNPSAADEALRNIVPFWTFMSQNLPNQLTNRWTNPRAYAIYNSFTRNMDTSTEEDLVPSYMKEQGAFKIGGRTWLQPDLPMTRVNQQLAELAQPNRLLSYVNPLLRLPIELAGNTKLYTGQQFSEDPQDLTLASKLASPLLALTGQLQQDATGGIKTSEKANYALMNLLPPFSVAERLFPQTGPYAQKRAASTASWFGLPIRNVPEDMEDKEARSRAFAMQRYLQQQRALGFGKEPD
jgi:hypothetical protein